MMDPGKYDRLYRDDVERGEYVSAQFRDGASRWKPQPAQEIIDAESIASCDLCGEKDEHEHPLNEYWDTWISADEQDGEA